MRTYSRPRTYIDTGQLTIPPRGNVGRKRNRVSAPRPWNPLDIPDVVFWLPTAYTDAMWTGHSNQSRSTRPADDDDYVGSFDEPASGFSVEAPGNLNRPLLKSDETQKSYVEFSPADGSNDSYVVVNSAKPLRILHEDRNFTFMFKAKSAAGDIGTERVLFDQINGTSANIGISIRMNAANQWRAAIATGTSILTLLSEAKADSDWHQIVIKVAPGSNACSLQVDDDTPVTGTVGNGLAADATSDLWIGMRTSTQQPFRGGLADPVIAYGIVSDEDIAKWRAFNPNRTSTRIARELIEDQSELDPDEVSNLWAWWRLSDASLLYQDSSGTTPVASNDDPVGLVVAKNTAPGGHAYNRNLSQATDVKRPLWKTNQVNSLGAVVWSGTAADATAGDYDGENNLTLPTFPYGQVTLIVVYQQLTADPGSHLFSAGGSGQPYVVQTGSGYQSGARGDIVVHWNGAARSSPNGVGEAVNVAVVRGDGNLQGHVALGNQWGDALLPVGNLRLAHMGRPEKSGGWDMNGFIAEVVVYNAWLSDATITKLTRTLVDRYAITEVNLG